jgi:hypothetical protein
MAPLSPFFISIWRPQFLLYLNKIDFFFFLFSFILSAYYIKMSKAIIEALAMRVEALEKSDKTTSMRVDALEKTLASQLNVQPKPQDDKKKDKEEKKEKAAAKKEKKAKTDPADAKPKRVTGYILFCNSNRDDVKTKLSIDDEKPKNTEVLTELARLWKAIDSDEKDEWNAKAKAKSNPLPNKPNHHDDDDEEQDDDDDNDE